MDRDTFIARRDARTAQRRAAAQSRRDAMNQRRAARGLKPYGMKSGGDVMDDKMGRAMSKRGDMSDKMGRAMAGGMKSGGKVKKMQVGGMASKLASIRENQAARRARNQERLNRVRAARERFAARKAGMKSGGDVKKYAEGGAIYRKAADGVATKGKTKGTQIKMRKGGMC